MKYSITYIATIIGTILSVGDIAIIGQSDLETTVKTVIVIALGVITLYGRYRAGGLHWTGLRTSLES